MGVKNSTSDLFISNCDEFLYYDDLVRAERAKPRRRGTATGEGRAAKASEARAAAAEPEPSPGSSLSPDKAIEQVLETFDAIREERDEDDRIWGSMIKQALKRRNPGFNERAHGFRSFNDLLLEAQKRGLLKLEHDEKSGGYLVTPAE